MKYQVSQNIGQLLSRTMFKLNSLQVESREGSSSSPMSSTLVGSERITGKEASGDTPAEWQVFDEDRPLSNSNDRRVAARVWPASRSLTGDGNKTIKCLGRRFVRRVMPTITSHLRSRRFSFRWWVGINFQPPPSYSLIFLPLALLEGQPPRNFIHLRLRTVFSRLSIFSPFVLCARSETPSFFSLFFFFSSRPSFDFRGSFSIYPTLI